MRAKRVRLVLVLAAALAPSSAAGFSPARPERRDIFSANRLFVLDADPKTGVNTVYAADDRATPLWSFPGTVWLADALVSNDGTIVAVVGWSFVRDDDLPAEGAVVFRNRDGVFRSYSVSDLCPHPLRTRDIGPGPVGNFWRTWQTGAWSDGERLVVRTTGGLDYVFHLADGTVAVRRPNIHILSKWCVVVPALALGATAAGVWGYPRLRRGGWPRVRRALSQGLLWFVCYLAPLGSAAYWVIGGAEPPWQLVAMLGALMVALLAAAYGFATAWTDTALRPRPPETRTAS